LSELKCFILCPFNHFVLQVGVHIVEIVAVTGHSHQQITVIFGASLRCQQSCSVNHIKLNVVTSERKVTADEVTQFFDVFFTFQQAGNKTEVQQGTARFYLVEFAQRTDDIGWPVRVATV